MQSLSRAIRRNNAVLAFNNVTKQMNPVWKRGSTREKWLNAVKNRLSLTEQEYCESVT